ncbi:twin-arginine translocase subunit TatC [Blastopirellula marina]|uniref:Sec-independent protein translocase protein TatC n=1 Tax=Blastopirellula marina TaxID=124 RepID=A0A2S8F1Y6_9BACT|nr:MULTISPECIES: twin-arginine translocase subunit TatC [Pirellulaceae]PQO26195.1 twin-arginine translocase subunit TatC [Blastopirellula marina]RCS44554.1 twin-arginine translocase subunit TatC [Bremerella cremea]
MNSKINDDFFEGSSMSFGDHLEELRTCLFRAVIWLAVGVAIGLYFGSDVVKFLERPIQSALVRYYQKKSISQLEENLGIKLNGDQQDAVAKHLQQNDWIAVDMWIEPAEITRLSEAKNRPLTEEAPAAEPAEEPEKKVDTSELPQDASYSDEDILKALQAAKVLPTEAPVRMRTWQRIQPSTEALRAEEVFMVWLKAGIVFGFIIASPGIFWHLWQFVAAGLYPHEKKYVWIFMPFSLSLFFGGAAIAYFMAFDPVLDFLFQFNLMTGIDPRPRINEWLGFVIMLPLGFGISFQLPLVMLLLNRIGLFTIEAYTKNWRIAVMVIFVLSMILTPSDPISMLLLAVPLTFLYGLGIGLCKWMPGIRKPFPAT